jgi:2-keto-3-deoxy-L-rhamnonate aldolase RhmA
MKQVSTIYISAMAVVFAVVVLYEARSGGAVSAQVAEKEDASRPAPKGTVKVMPIDAARPWGWAVRAYMEQPDRKLYNTLKAKLLAGKSVGGFSQLVHSVEGYCALAKDPQYDHTWFEMQHSTLRFDQVQSMIAACPGVGATPIIRVPHPDEGSMQKAFDLGALGVVVPEVNDAQKAMEAAKYARTAPLGRRSSGSSTAVIFWGPFIPKNESWIRTSNDNTLLIVMIESPEGVDNALAIASVPGVDVVMVGNSDMSFATQMSPFDVGYQDLMIRVRNATYQAGKFWGMASGPVGVGNVLTPDSRFNTYASRTGTRLPKAGFCPGNPAAMEC